MRIKNPTKPLCFSQSSFLFTIEISDKIFVSLFRSFQLKASVLVRHSTVDWNFFEVLKPFSILPKPILVLDIRSKWLFFCFIHCGQMLGRSSQVLCFQFSFSSFLSFLFLGLESFLNLVSSILV